jgi:hypothetical protein
MVSSGTASAFSAVTQKIQKKNVFEKSKNVFKTNNAETWIDGIDAFLHNVLVTFRKQFKQYQWY